MDINYTLKATCLIPLVQVGVGGLAAIGYGCRSIAYGVSAALRLISAIFQRILSDKEVSESKMEGLGNACENLKSNAKNTLIFIGCAIPIVGCIVALAACITHDNKEIMIIGNDDF